MISQSRALVVFKKLRKMYDSLVSAAAVLTL